MHDRNGVKFGRWMNDDEEFLYFKKSEKVFPPAHVVAGSGSVPVHASQG